MEKNNITRIVENTLAYTISKAKRRTYNLFVSEKTKEIILKELSDMFIEYLPDTKVFIINGIEFYIDTVKDEYSDEYIRIENNENTGFNFKLLLPIVNGRK